MESHEVTRLQWICRPATLPAGPAAGAAPLKGLDGRAAELAEKCAVVSGLGAVGGICFTELARLGVGRLYGVDMDRYGDEDSWSTQPMRRVEDAGAHKAVVQARMASEANPACSVAAAIGFAQDLPLWVLCQADVLIVAGDNLELAVWAGNMGAALGIPVLVGAVEGETWWASCRGFDLTDPEAASVCCAMSADEWKTLRSRHGCDPHTARTPGAEPTRTLPCVCGTAAMLTAAEAVKTLLAVEGRLRGEEAALCLLSQKSFRTRYVRDPSCRCPHERWNVVRLEEPPAQLDLSGLIARQAATSGEASCSDGSDLVLVRGERRWCRQAVCAGCGRKTAVRRFAEAGADLGACECGKRLLASPMGLSSVLPQDDVQECLDASLSELGVAPGGAIAISRGDGPWCYFLCGEPLPLRSLDDEPSK